MKIKQTIKKIEEEIKFFGGKDFDKRKDVDLTDEGDLTATLKEAKLSGYKLALKDVLSEIDNWEKKVMKEGKRLSELADKHFAKGNKNDGRRARSSSLTIGINVKRLIKEELKKPIQEILKG